MSDSTSQPSQAATSGKYVTFKSDHTPYSKMAAASDDLGRVAQE